MNTHPTLEAVALAAMLVISSCISIESHDHKPATTTVTRETVQPGTGVKQTTQTTTTRVP